MYHAINEYQLRLDVQCFLWPVNYIILYYIILYYIILYYIILYYAGHDKKIDPPPELIFLQIFFLSAFAVQILR